MVAIEKMNNFPLAGREVRSFLPSARNHWLIVSRTRTSQIKVGLVADRSNTFNKPNITTVPETNLQHEEQGESIFFPARSIPGRELTVFLRLD